MSISLPSYPRKRTSSRHRKRHVVPITGHLPEDCAQRQATRQPAVIREPSLRRFVILTGELRGRFVAARLDRSATSTYSGGGMSHVYPRRPGFILRSLQSLSGRTVDPPEPARRGPGPAGTPRPAEPPQCQARGAPPGQADFRPPDKAEIIRQLRTIRYSSQRARISKRAPTLRQIARTAGVSHMLLYRAVRTGNLSAEAAVALGPVLERNIVA